MASEAPSILLVDDDSKLTDLLRAYLAPHGFRIEVEEEGAAAIRRIRSENPNLVVLDLMLPGVSGLDVCQQVRSHYQGGILMLSARKADTDQVVLLEVGADDYVHKPVEPRVLLARIRSLIRRLSLLENPKADEVTLGGLSIHRTRREVRFDRETVPVTSVELDVLWLLASRAGEVVTRDELYSEVRGTRYDGLDRGMDIHVSRLRKKLAEAGMSTPLIKSIRGSGYLLAKP